jgi:hypothetical protein
VVFPSAISAESNWGGKDFATPAKWLSRRKKSEANQDETQTVS